MFMVRSIFIIKSFFSKKANTILWKWKDYNPLFVLMNISVGFSEYSFSTTPFMKANAMLWEIVGMFISKIEGREEEDTMYVNPPSRAIRT